jgi:serine/threonine-protein kinase
LLMFLSGRGPTLEALEERYRAHIAAGKIVDATSALRALREEMGSMLGEQPKNSRDWFKAERKAWRRIAVACAAIATLLGGAAIGWTLIQQHGRPLPNVVGASKTQAVAVLQKGGWKVRIVYQRSEVLPGKVLSQRPAAHQTLAGGKLVVLNISKAKRVGRVPQLAGLDINNARDELWAAGFNWKAVARKGGHVGVVTDSTPKPGTILPQGTVVVVYYGAP